MSQEDENQEDKKFSERAKETAARVKQHLKDNKKVYLAAGGGIAVGAIGMFVVTGRYGQFVDSLKLIHIQYKSPNVNLALVKQACPDPIPVRDKMTGIPYPSMKTASKLTQQAYDYIRHDVHGVQSRWERLPDTVFA